MSHTVENKKKLLTRIRRIKGQAAALEAALEGEAGCLETLQQIAAIRGAINGLMGEVLESHIREHIGGEGITQKRRDEEIENVVSILKSYLK